MVHPLEWMGSVCWSCIHVGCTCANHFGGLCAGCICMVSVMVVVMSPCERGCCFFEVFHQECMIGYEFLCVFHAYMSVSYVFYMFVDYVLVVYAWWWSSLWLCCHVEVDGVVYWIVSS